MESGIEKGYFKKKFLSRKFILSLLIISVVSVGLFMGVLSGSEFVAATSLIMGLYGATNSANAFATARTLPQERHVEVDVQPRPRERTERVNQPEE